jgi:hypothetical protein
MMIDAASMIRPADYLALARLIWNGDPPTPFQPRTLLRFTSGTGAIGTSPNSAGGSLS